MIEPGQTHSMAFQFTQEKVDSFAEVSGDDNPIHIDAEFAANTRFQRPIVHGAFLTSLVSRGLGREFPGAGTIYVSQEATFLAPVYTDDSVTVQFTVLELLEKGRVQIQTEIFRDSDGTKVLSGVAQVIVRPPKPS